MWPYPVLSTQPTSSLTKQPTYEIQYAGCTMGSEPSRGERRVRPVDELGRGRSGGAASFDEEGVSELMCEVVLLGCGAVSVSQHGFISKRT